MSKTYPPYLLLLFLLLLLLLWPEVEVLEVGVGGEAGAELGEALLVVAKAVPLEAEPGEAGAQPQEVAQRHHAAPRHVVPAEVERPDAGAPHYSLAIQIIEPLKHLISPQNTINFPCSNKTAMRREQRFSLFQWVSNKREHQE